MDVAGFHIVTVGARASEHAQQLYAGNAYQAYLYWHGFGVEMAEALAVPLRLWGRRVQVVSGVIIILVGAVLVYAAADPGALSRLLLS